MTFQFWSLIMCFPEAGNKNLIIFNRSAWDHLQGSSIDTAQTPKSYPSFFPKWRPCFSANADDSLAPVSGFVESDDFEIKTWLSLDRIALPKDIGDNSGRVNLLRRLLWNEGKAMPKHRVAKSLEYPQESQLAPLTSARALAQRIKAWPKLAYQAPPLHIVLTAIDFTFPRVEWSNQRNLIWAK